MGDQGREGQAAEIERVDTGRAPAAASACSSFGRPRLRVGSPLPAASPRQLRAGYRRPLGMGPAVTAIAFGARHKQGGGGTIPPPSPYTPAAPAPAGTHAGNQAAEGAVRADQVVEQLARRAAQQLARQPADGLRSPREGREGGRVKAACGASPELRASPWASRAGVLQGLPAGRCLSGELGRLGLTRRGECHQRNSAAHLVPGAKLQGVAVGGRAAAAAVVGCWQRVVGPQMGGAWPDVAHHFPLPYGRITVTHTAAATPARPSPPPDCPHPHARRLTTVAPSYSIFSASRIFWHHVTCALGSVRYDIGSSGSASSLPLPPSSPAAAGSRGRGRARDREERCVRGN
jgi:hypothetical protein